jgi:hypothetical protein
MKLNKPAAVTVRSSVRLRVDAPEIDALERSEIEASLIRVEPARDARCFRCGCRWSER